jgi:hypothetical protein
MPDNREKIQFAKDHAPSYFNLLDDGADFLCHECGERSRRGMIVAYTPDGKQDVMHYECADEDWIKKATCYGAI